MVASSHSRRQKRRFGAVPRYQLNRSLQIDILTDGSIGPFTSPQLRCLVTTHSLDVGGLDRFAVFLARRLPSFGIDTTIAHTPITDTPHTGSGDALGLGGPRVLKLSPSEAHKWLKTN